MNTKIPIWFLEIIFQILNPLEYAPPPKISETPRSLTADCIPEKLHPVSVSLLGQPGLHPNTLPLLALLLVTHGRIYTVSLFSACHFLLIHGSRDGAFLCDTEMGKISREYGQEV